MIMETLKAPKNLKWHVLGGGFFCYLFDAMDLVLLAVALPAIMKTLNLSLTEAGLLGTATLVGVGLSSVLMGWYSDNYGRRKALIGGLVMFGVLTAAIALTNSWLEILVLRFLAGLGLGGVWGVIAAYIAETWPAEQRGRAAAFILSSWSVGAAGASFLAAALLSTYGWRALFVCGGGSVFAALYAYVFIPESPAWKAQNIERGATSGASVKVSITEIFARDLIYRTVLATIVAGSVFIAYWGALSWLPTYLVRDRGLDMQTMGTFMGIANIGMFFGYQISGYLADKLGRKKALIISFLGMAFTLPVYAFVEDRTALFWMGPIYGIVSGFVGLFGSYFGELFPTRVRTLGAGFCFNVGRGTSALAPLLLGWVAAHHSLSVGLMLCGAFFMLAAIFILFLPETKTSAANCEVVMVPAEEKGA